MPNIGHTAIEATGSPHDLAALAAHVRGTACGSSAFTLSGLMHPDPVPDHAVRWAELSATDEMVSLAVYICFPVSAPEPGSRCASLVRCFRRTPARSTAALDRFDAALLAQLADRPAVAGGWRDAAADGLEVRVWWHPDAADETSQALVARDGAFVLLTGMDCHGGYDRKEDLDAEAAARRLPEPAETRRQPQTALRFRRVCG